MPEPSVAVGLEGGGLFDGGFVEAVEEDVEFTSGGYSPFWRKLTRKHQSIPAHNIHIHFIPHRRRITRLVSMPRLAVVG